MSANADSIYSKLQLYNFNQEYPHRLGEILIRMVCLRKDLHFLDRPQ